MFASDVVIQTVAVGVAENPGKMTVTPVVLVITNQTRTLDNGEGHQTVSEMVDLVPAEEAVLEGKKSIEFDSQFTFCQIEKHFWMKEKKK